MTMGFGCAAHPASFIGKRNAISARPEVPSRRLRRVEAERLLKVMRRQSGAALFENWVKN